jgi:hypothetical protein
MHQTLILWVMHYIPRLCLRCNEDTEIVGVDDAEMGEYAYDYVGQILDVGPRQMYSDDVGSTRGGRGSIIRQRRDTYPLLPSGHRCDTEADHFPMQAYASSVRSA